MKTKLIQNKRFIANAIIYLLIIAGIAGLIYMNRAGKEYQMFNHPKTLTNKNDIETERLSLPKGTYYLVVNYAVSADIPVTVYIDQSDQITGSLTRNQTGAYYTLSFEVKEPTSLFHMVFTNGAVNGFQLYNYEMSASRVFYNDDAYFALVFLFLAVLLYLFLHSRFFRELPARGRTIFLVLSGLVLFSSYPLFTDYLVYGHDLQVHLMRIEGVKDALLNGQFPAAIYPNSNNGYGTLGFTYPNFFLYLPAVLRMFDVSMVTAYQTLLVLINIATAAAVYFSIKSVSKSDYASLTASVLYMLAPYRLSDLYVRSALGESLAMIFLPVALAGLYHIFLGEKKKWYLLVIGYTGILQSHVLSCLLVAFVSVIIGISLFKYLLVNGRYFALLKALGVSAFLNLWYLLPFFAFSANPLGLSTIENSDFYEDAIFAGQLFMTKASTYVTLATEKGIGLEMQLSIGMAGCVALLLIGVFLFCEREQVKKPASAQTDSETAVKKEKGAFRDSMRMRINTDGTYHWLLILIDLSVLTIFLSTTIFPWKRLSDFSLIRSIMEMVQFPFRFLTVATVCLSFGCGLAIVKSAFLSRYKKELFGVLLLLSLTGAYEMLDEYIQQEVYVTNVAGGFSERELPEYWPQGTTRELFKDTQPHEYHAKLSDYEKKGTTVTFSYTAEGEDASVTLPLLLYPGYYAKLDDGTRLQIEPNEENKVQVLLPETSVEQTVTVGYSYWRIFNSSR